MLRVTVMHPSIKLRQHRGTRMNGATASSDAIACIDEMLGKAPAHVRARWTELRTYLDGETGDDAETTSAMAHEDEMLEHISVRGNMFHGSDRSVELTIDFPFSIRPWFDGHSHFEFEREESGRDENERMLAFYRQQEAEKKRLYGVVRSTIAPLVIDCLRRMLGRDMRTGRDEVLQALKHSTWLKSGRQGPAPHPDGQPPAVVYKIIR